MDVAGILHTAIPCEDPQPESLAIRGNRRTAGARGRAGGAESLRTNRSRRREQLHEYLLKIGNELLPKSAAGKRWLMR